jgi:hypothetical protein
VIEMLEENLNKRKMATPVTIEVAVVEARGRNAASRQGRVLARLYIG